MKTVVSNSMVAHLWAAQSQPEGRNSSGSFHFADSVLYSYATPVANILTAKGGVSIALLSRERYSPTTGKQLRYAWRAVDHLEVFHAKHVGATGGRAPFAGSDFHKDNVAVMVEEYHAGVARMLRRNTLPYTWDAGTCETKESTRADVLKGLRYTSGKIALYCQLFKVRRVGSIDTAADADRLMARYTVIAARLADPKLEEKRAKARAQREERARVKAEREQAILVERLQSDIANWRAGAFIRHGNLYRVPVMLRLSADGKRAETSHGAEVSRADAEKFLALRAKFLRNGTTYERSDSATPAVAVGAFTLHSIRADGSVQIGCHNISSEEIERLETVLLEEVSNG